jgi:hypothetical protein
VRGRFRSALAPWLRLGCLCLTHVLGRLEAYPTTSSAVSSGLRFKFNMPSVASTSRSKTEIDS